MGKDAPFIVGTLRLSLHLPQVHSLKEKRQVLKSLKDNIRNRFNVSIAELGQLDKWQVADMGIAMCGNDQANIDAVFNKLLNTIRSYPRADLTVFEMEFSPQ
ncbi:DUF503 domain-containing protein [Planctomycetota bacterium]